MDAIATGLLAAAAVTAVHGRIVVLTYSSTEDRTAKTTLRRLSAHHRETRNIFDEASVAQGPPFSLPSPRVLTPPVVPVLRIVTPKPLVPTAEEKRSNPRSRSAKLRAAEKVAATVNVQ
jgi:16S rRNA (cytosine1402-N4)-methyltransferase